MKISIVMAYYNRKSLLLNTLKSISDKNVEIIVVDDASDDNHRLDDVKGIKLIRVDKDTKKWINPCIPFNMGFKQAIGDVVIIQNPECIHFGNIVQYVKDNIREGLYLNFACYSIDEFKTKQIKNAKSIGRVISPLVKRGVVRDGETAWYNHSIYRPHKLHFCSAIMKSDLDKLGGFDERFSLGIGYDDNEFLYRLEKNLVVDIIDRPFVIHQYHGVTDYSNRDLVLRNKILYEKLKKNNQK